MSTSSGSGGKPADDLLDGISFTDGRTEKMLAMTLAVTRLGTRLFGRYGQGAGVDKKALNFIKKDADAISAYAMSESLWYLTRTVPENHAIMVCLGEGLMPKGGETSEMGANPLLGFGRIYARPQVAKFLETCVHRLINDRGYLPGRISENPLPGRVSPSGGRPSIPWKTHPGLPKEKRPAQ